MQKKKNITVSKLSSLISEGNLRYQCLRYQELFVQVVSDYADHCYVRKDLKYCNSTCIYFHGKKIYGFAVFNIFTGDQICNNKNIMLVGI